MPHTRKKIYPKSSSSSNQLFFDFGSTLMIFQRESEKMIWKADFENKNIYNASDFKIKKI